MLMYPTNFAEPTLEQFIRHNRPDVVDVVGPDAEGNYEFKGQLRTVLVETTQEVVDPETEEVTDVIVQSEVVENTPLENEQGILDLIALYEPTMQKLAIFKKVQSAREFGNNLISKFAMENILLGITQAAMTSTVRKATAEVMNALQAGSLYDAIDELKAIPAEDKDSVFLTNVRLLQYLNEIEQYLDIPLTTEL